MSDLELLKFFSLAQARLEREGFELTACDDHDDAERRALRLGKNSLTPMHAGAYHDFTSANSFWLFLTKEGEDAGCVAARLDHIASETLDAFWQRTYRRLYNDGSRLQTCVPQRSFLSQISGRVAYMGELFIAPQFRGSDNRLRCYVSALFVLCAMRFRPDWLYVFVTNEHALNGKADVYGFPHHIPGAQIWRDVPSGRHPDEVLCAISIGELNDLAHLYARLPDRFVIPDLRRGSERGREG